MYRPRLPAELRQIVLELYNHQCVDCGRSRWLQVHHKDEDFENNNLENLEVKCVLCHMMRHPQNFENMLLFAINRYGDDIIQEL